jgi:hypothetical protein
VGDHVAEGLVERVGSALVEEATISGNSGITSTSRGNGTPSISTSWSEGHSRNSSGSEPTSPPKAPSASSDSLSWARISRAR